MRIFVPVIAAVLALAVGIGILPGILGGGKYPFQKGTVVEQNIPAGKEATVGDLKKTGWQFQIPKNAFDNDISLTMRVVSETDAAGYPTDGFEFVGTPVSISVEGEERSVWLNRPVTVTLRIPKEQRAADDTADDYLAAYFNGREWEYIFPDISKIGEGYITFETYHFSDYAAIRLKNDKEKVKLYTKKMAAQAWEDDENKKALDEKLGDMFKDALDKMDIKDESVKGKILRTIMKESDFGTLIVSAERGDVADFGAKCGEMAANALLKHLKLDDALMENITGMGSAAGSALVKSALQIYDGKYEDALKELSSGFIGYFPAGKAMQIMIELTEASIASWKDYELEEAYNNYIKDAGDVSTVSDDVWAAMVAAQMRGYLIRLQDEAKDRYCAVNGITRKELDADAELSRRLERQAENQLRATFEKRLANKQDIEEREAEYAEIIEGFQEAGLLKRGSFGFDTSRNVYITDMQDRLRTLFGVRQIILDMFGGEMPVLNAGETAEENLNEAIGKWLQLGSKNRAKFYEWLVEKGYKSKVKLTEDPKQAEFGWVLTGTVDGDPTKGEFEEYNKSTKAYRNSGVYSPGNFTIKKEYIGSTDTWYDPDKIHGESYTLKAVWSAPPQIIREGELLTMTLNLSSEANNSFFDFGGYAYAHIGNYHLKNSEGKGEFQSKRYNGYQSHNETVSIAPSGSKFELKVVGTMGNSNSAMSTTYIYEWKQLD